MMTQYTIRQACLQDVEQIAEVYLEAFASEAIRSQIYAKVSKIDRMQTYVQRFRKRLITLKPWDRFTVLTNNESG